MKPGVIKLPPYRSVANVKVWCPVVGCNWTFEAIGNTNKMPSAKAELARHWIGIHNGDWSLRFKDPNQVVIDEITSELLDVEVSLR